MCFSEYFAVIPQGCCAENKHAYVLKDVVPCFETVFLSIARNADAGGDPATLNITLCGTKDCLKIDCFRQKLEVKALQAKVPYCPVCLGKKTLAEALMVQDNENTQYAILPNGNVLRPAADNHALPKYVVQRQFFLKREIMAEPKPIRVKTDVASKLRRPAPRHSKLPAGTWDEPDIDDTFNMYVSMFMGLYNKHGRNELEEVPGAELPWFYDTWTDEE